jgi:hypothetical protein
MKSFFAAVLLATLRASAVAVGAGCCSTSKNANVKTAACASLIMPILVFCQKSTCK